MFPSSLSPALTPAVKPFFAGKSKKTDASQIAQIFLESGLNRKTLQQDWGVTLWDIRVKDHRVHLRMEADRPVDSAALERAFLDALNIALEQPWQIKLHFKPISKCCGKGCKGCLAGSKKTRKIWIG